MSSRICVVLAFLFIFTINNVNGAIDIPKLLVTSKPLKFAYDERNLLKMNISFKLPPDVNAGYVMLRYKTQGSLNHNSVEGIEIRRPYHGDELDDPVAVIKSFARSDHVFIYVNLYNQTGVSLSKLILEGRAVGSVLKSNHLESAYSLLCLNGKSCEVKADLRKPNKEDYATVIIILSAVSLAIFLLAIVALVIVTFKKRWCSKKEMPEILNVPKPKFHFYSNLLFEKDNQKNLKDEEKNNQSLNTEDRGHRTLSSGHSASIFSGLKLPSPPVENYLRM